MVVSTSAGLSALGRNTLGSSFQRTISSRSPPSSSTIFLIRAPRTPTQAPTQSICWSTLATATLERYPASRAKALISITFSAISGISISNRRRTNSGCLRDRMTRTRVPDFLTSNIVARTLSPDRCVSPGICSPEGRIPSVFPILTVTAPLSLRPTDPETIIPCCC